MNIRNKIHREEKKKKLKTKYSEINKMNMQIKETEINSSEIQRISTIASNLKDDKRKFIYIVSEIQKVQDINKNGNKIISQVNKNLIKNRTNFKLRHGFMNLVILLIKFLFIFNEIKQENSLLEFTEINLKINAIGNNKILSDYFFEINRPCEIYINDSLVGEIKNEYYINNTEIIAIKIRWNNSIETTENMFSNCDSIIEIDLSNFNTSHTTNMSSMFYNCSSLEKLTLSNLDTSQVCDMTYMFYNCASLIELNLNNIDTSNVKNMSNMFAKCSLLNSLNVNNFKTFNVIDMSNMFYGCSSLKTMTLSNFDTSHVTNMNRMFVRCYSLKSLNLLNFITSQVTNMAYMFYNCSSLRNLKISNFDTSNVITMTHMFYYCSSLTTLKISNFKTSNVITMDHMFFNCDSLDSLNLYNFDTSSVRDMSYMFGKCSKLSSLNISSFDTLKVTKMNRMFYECIKLNNLSLSNFNTSNVKNMGFMFCHCSSLTSLDISNFDTSKATDMTATFAKCYKLSSLDLSNFNTSRVKNISYIFYQCYNLCLIDISSFKTSEVIDMSHMFHRCYSLNSLNLSNFDTSNTEKMDNMFYNCSSLKSLDLSNFNTMKVNNMTNMFYNCTNLTYLDISNFNESRVKYIYNMFFNCSSLISLNLSNFDTSNIFNLYNMFFKCNNSEYINFGLQNSNSTLNDILLFTQKNLDIDDKNKSDISIDLNLFSNDFIYCCNTQNNYICYNKNLSLFNNTCDICGKEFFLDQNNLIRTNNINISLINCLDEEPSISCYDSCEICNLKGNKTHHNCLKCKDEFIYEINITNSSYKNCYKIDPSSLQYTIDEIINEFNVTELNSGEDKKIIDKNKIIILTSTVNQKKNEESNNITMNLDQCENLLKSDYNISNNDSLYILQIISEEEGMKIPKIEYEVYYPLDGYNLKKLNLTSCKNSKIEISIKVSINGSIDKYNPKSDYYNDICSKTTSEDGTDITLKDRKNEFIENNMSLCEENCELIEYNTEKEKAKCSCGIKLDIIEKNDIKFNKEDFFKSFIDIKNMFNLNIIKCYKEVFKYKNLINNYGFFIAGSLIILYFISSFIFSVCSFNKIKRVIFNIIFSSKLNGNPVKKSKKKKKKKVIKKDIKDMEEKTIKQLNLLIKVKDKREKNKEIVTQNIENNSINRMHSSRKYIIFDNDIDYNKIFVKKDFELNSLNYLEAIKLDHRNYCEYYISLIKYNHPILFSFAPYDDYNSKIIKIFLFFFSFCLDFTINALFFTDETMHKIYQDKGKFDFLYQIPQIIYSTLISKFIDTFIRFFALSQDDIIEFKRVKVRDKKNMEKRHKKLLRNLIIKFILFFLFAFVIILCSGYYLSCFCGIYMNTQIHLIKDSMISLIISLLIPFIFYLVPGIFRISALRNDKPNRIMLYKVSQFIENWFC